MLLLILRPFLRLNTLQQQAARLVRRRPQRQHVLLQRLRGRQRGGFLSLPSPSPLAPAPPSWLHPDDDEQKGIYTPAADNVQ